jgi:hypothetical protein
VSGVTHSRSYRGSDFSDISDISDIQASY